MSAANAANANVVFMFPYPCFGWSRSALCRQRAWLLGREVCWLHNLVLRHLDQVANLGQEGLPPWIGHQPLAPCISIVQAGKCPDMDDLVDGADLRKKVTNQRAEMALLDFDSLILDELEILRDGAVLQSVGPDLVEHRRHLITKGSGIGSSD